MSTATVSSPSGFNTTNFWISNTGQSTNETFQGLTSSSGNLLSSHQTETYSEFDFLHNGLLYRYVGSWTVTADRNILTGTLHADGAYNQIIVESAGTQVATYTGPTETVNFGSFTGGGVLNIVGGLVNGVVDLLFGGANGVASYANLHLDATPSLPAQAFADGALLTGGLGGDTLTGSGGIDVLIGGGGSDVLDGAGGADTAVFSQARAAYTITQSTVNGAVVTTVSGGADGTDTLTNVENLRFGGVNGTTLTLAQALDTAAPTVTVTSPGGLTNQAGHVIAGTVGVGDAGTAVGIYEGTSLLGSAVVQADGTWSAGVTLVGDGVHTLVAHDTDTSGNLGLSSPIVFTLDTTADSGAPITVSVNDTADHVIDAAEAHAVAFTVAGLDPGAAAAVTFTDGTHTAAATAGSDGVYAADLSGLNGSVSSNVLVTDPAGNTVTTHGNTVVLNTTPGGMGDPGTGGTGGTGTTPGGTTSGGTSGNDGTGGTGSTAGSGVTGPSEGGLHDVFRFYDTVTNDHFYTTDPNEAASIKANLPTFTYEGVPWETPDKGANTMDVFRFYDTVTKTHFLTTSTAERDTILKELPTFTFEGVAFQAYANVADSGEFALERFYNTNSKVHTYAADANEVALIKSGAVGQGWVDEGASFIVHHPTSDGLHA